MTTHGIKAIFFTRFHPSKGSTVLHQVPEGSITPSASPSPSALSAPLFDFDAVSSYVIPTQQFCDRLLSFCVSRYRVIGYPVCIRDDGGTSSTGADANTGGKPKGKSRYRRNEFIFNFALVVEEAIGDWVAYGEVVRKMGLLLRGLEEQGGWLSREEEEEGEAEGEESLSGSGKVYALCEVVMEDLNNYAECMIPIDDTNTLNLKLFPTRAPPPPIHAHQVPLLTISLSSLHAPLSSDLTLARILPHINGVNSVAHIAALADTDLALTRKAVQHLVYYGCLVLLDIFSFAAVYAPTAEIAGLVAHAEVLAECARYVAAPVHPHPQAPAPAFPWPHRRTPSSSSTSSESSTETSLPFHASSTASAQPLLPSPTTLITLYTSLRQGHTLRAFVLEHAEALRGIDIRRFITFGIVKGFLYRVHRYAILVPPAGGGGGGATGGGGGGGGAGKEGEEAKEEDAKGEAEGRLVRFLDGMHCFDEMGVEVGIGGVGLEERVRAVSGGGGGEVVFVQR